jgi:uncharacterized protein
MKLLCIYHANCADGFGAAWVVWKYFKGEVDFVAAQYGDETLPDVEGRDAVVVDFSFKFPVLLDLGRQARSLLVLDHHETAEKDLANFGYDMGRWPEQSWARWQEVKQRLVEEALSPCATLFDMNRSGAMITWDFFFPGAEPPRLLLHIQDRDLWRYELDGTAEIQAALTSHPYEFELWNQFMCREDGTDVLRAEGTGICRWRDQKIDGLVADHVMRRKIAGHDVPCINANGFIASELGNKLCQNELFSASWFELPNGDLVFSLRSSKNDGLNVADIAASYGGGGHKHAAGFRVASMREL